LQRTGYVPRRGADEVSSIAGDAETIPPHNLWESKSAQRRRPAEGVIVEEEHKLRRRPHASARHERGDDAHAAFARNNDAPP
jgi:hypothetical protein